MPQALMFRFILGAFTYENDRLWTYFIFIFQRLDTIYQISSDLESKLMFKVNTGLYSYLSVFDVDNEKFISNILYFE